MVCVMVNIYTRRLYIYTWVLKHQQNIHNKVNFFNFEQQELSSHFFKLKCNSIDYTDDTKILNCSGSNFYQVGLTTNHKFC